MTAAAPPMQAMYEMEYKFLLNGMTVGRKEFGKFRKQGDPHKNRCVDTPPEKCNPNANGKNPRQGISQCMRRYLCSLTWTTMIP